LIRVLLDTCVWIWLASDRQRLSEAAGEAIAVARKESRVGVSGAPNFPAPSMETRPTRSWSPPPAG